MREKREYGNCENTNQIKRKKNQYTAIKNVIFLTFNKYLIYLTVSRELINE